MPKLGDILNIASREEFDRMAMDVFRRQSAECQPYSDYIRALGVDPLEVREVGQIPFLPIELFKTHKIYSSAEDESEAIFTSSGEVQSRHYVARLSDYERVFRRCFELFYGDPAEWNIRSLLPCYEERTGSSLIYMVDRLKAMGSDNAPKKLLIGVSYALLDLAESGEKLPKRTIVMETGGMKGRRAEMSKGELHAVLSCAFGVKEIHSEYGMAELTSQAYSLGGGVFRSPEWMRVLVRDPNDPFDIRRSGRGGINIIDLANIHSCAFIETQDIGSVEADGSFTVDGRLSGADLRGCNLLVQ